MDLQRKTGIERKSLEEIKQSLSEPQVKDSELLDASVSSAVECSLPCHMLSKPHELQDHLIMHNLLACFLQQNVTGLNVF